MSSTARPTPGGVDPTAKGADRGRPVRRRPSGDPPPLPREDRWTRWIWVLAAVLLVGVALNLLIQAGDVVETADRAVLSRFADTRAPLLTDIAGVVGQLATFAAVMTLRWATVVVLVVYRRFRHLVVFLATLVATDWVVARLLAVGLPRPEVPVLADGGGYAFSSRGIAALAITLFSMTFVLTPRGRARDRLRAAFTVMLVLVILAELYLAGDYLSAMVYVAILAPCVADVAFRWLVPEEGFPVTYRKRGSAAHLDLGGARGSAIVRAMADQLGLSVTEVKEFGLEGSGGSSRRCA